MRFSPLLAAAGLLLLGLVSCSKPRAGGDCKAGASACADATSRLVCEGAKWAAFPCKGPAGCADDGASCDLAAAVTGDPCPGQDEGRSSCSADASRELKCARGKLQVRACRGSHHCRSFEGKGTSCDVGDLEEGDPCSDAAPDCSKDHAALLACVGGKFTRVQACAGRNQCKETAMGPTCDATLSEPGQPCVEDLKGKTACSRDRHALLTCDGHLWSPSTPCPDGKSCAFTEMDLSCQSGAACQMSAKNAACQ